MTTDENAEAAPWSWRDVVRAALEAESKPDAFGLLHLVDLTDGKQGVPVSVDALAERLMVEVPTAKALLSRLEALGWVTRRAGLVDGRPVLVFDTAREVK